MHWRAVGRDRTFIADIAPGVMRGVGIEHLAVGARSWHTDPITGTHDRREIADHDKEPVGIASTTNVRDHARFVVVAVDPRESVAIAIELMQLLSRAVEAIEIADDRLNATVLGLLQQMPV